jgi:hypothetical protein
LPAKWDEKFKLLKNRKGKHVNTRFHEVCPLGREKANLLRGFQTIDL